MAQYSHRPCNCGSGEIHEPQFDGYGIFLTYTCSKCEKEKMSRYRKDIHEHYECDEAIDED
jgi:hypothetical protein